MRRVVHVLQAGRRRDFSCLRTLQFPRQLARNRSILKAGQPGRVFSSKTARPKIKDIVDKMLNNPLLTTVATALIYIGTQNYIWLVDCYNWYNHNYEELFQLSVLAEDVTKNPPEIRSYCLVEGRLSDYYPLFGVDAIHDSCSKVENNNSTNQGGGGRVWEGEDTENLTVIHLPESDATRVLLKTNNDTDHKQLVFALVHFGGDNSKINCKKVGLLVVDRAVVEDIASRKTEHLHDGDTVQGQRWNIIREIHKCLVGLETRDNEAAIQKLEKETFFSFFSARYSWWGLLGLPYYGNNLAKTDTVGLVGTCQIID
eukprot:jgi/Bigna1/67873/fgenesh1_pg.4_\